MWMCCGLRLREWASTMSVTSPSNMRTPGGDKTCSEMQIYFSKLAAETWQRRSECCLHKNARYASKQTLNEMLLCTHYTGEASPRSTVTWRAYSRQACPAGIPNTTAAHTSTQACLSLWSEQPHITPLSCDCREERNKLPLNDIH